MISIKSIVLSCAFVIATAASSVAATYHIGDVTSGMSVTKKLSVQKLDLIDFTLEAPSGYMVSALDISVSSIAGSNLREMIAVYSGTQLIASSDSGVGRGGGTAKLSFSGVNALADGTYTLAIGGWKSFFTKDIANARSTAYFNNGTYTVDFEPTLTIIPLPAGVFMLLTGMGALAFMRRRNHKPPV